jgi:hypothetical protein
MVFTLSAGIASAADLEPVYGYGVPLARPVVVSPWFVEGGVGVGWEWVDRLHFRNPLLATLLRANGDEIVMFPLKNNDKSFVANLGLGYFLDRHWYGKVEYRYLGHYTWSGTSAFAGNPPAANVLQEMSSTIHGVFVGVGYVHDFTPQIYIDASGELGAAFIGSSGTQGLGGYFPSGKQTNFAAVATFGGGYRVTPETSLTLTGNYHYVSGNVSTDVHPGSAIQFAGEQLFVRDIGILSVNLGVRHHF